MMQVVGAIVVLLLMMVSCATGHQAYEDARIKECQSKYNVYHCEVKAVPVTPKIEGEKP